MNAQLRAYALLLLVGCPLPPEAPDTVMTTAVGNYYRRFIDVEAQVVCWTTKGSGAPFCLPCSATALDCGEQR